jgi:hypothetical protein
MRVSAKIGVAVLSVRMILAPVHRLRAQFAVFDPVQTAASAIDALNQLFETMEEFDWIGDQWDEFNNMKAWFNNNFGEGSWYESFQDLMKDLDSFQRMGRQLEASARVSQMYATRLKNMAADGRFNPQYINGLQRQLLREFELIGNMVNQAGVIMRRNDIDRNEKIHLLDEASNRIATTARQTRNKIDDEMNQLDEVEAVVEAQNLLLGRSEGYGLDGIGAAHTGNVTTPSLPALQDRGNLSYGEAMGEHEGTFVEGSRNAFGAVTVALGILCALVLIVALAKFLKGEPGSEVVFLRIGVALLGGVAFLTILTKAFGF